jgi:hypothetical protein
MASTDARDSPGERPAEARPEKAGAATGQRVVAAVKASTEKMNGSPTAVLSLWSCLIRINIAPAPAGTSFVPTSGEVLVDVIKQCLCQPGTSLSY